MVKSMTAYGRGEYQLQDLFFLCEIRSLNNRYRDILLRIPRNFQAFEKDLRSIVSSKIRRGRIEISLQMQKDGVENPFSVELNIPLVNSYLKIFKELADNFGVSGKTNVESLCQMKDIIIMKPEEIDEEKAKAGFQQVLISALA